ncbi:MAG TPA: cytochrome c oxidase subunit II [Longimicrobium sp.]|nr:cytochrome c oxidase subunit II [Longimicrobium sp.]
MTRRPRASARLAPTLACAALAACGGPSATHSALHPAGPQAARLHTLWNFLWITAAAVVVLVVVALALALLRSRRRDAPATGPAAERGARRVVIAGTGVTLAILLAVLVSSYLIARDYTAEPSGDTPLRVTLTGHQWWWEVTYSDSVSGRSVTTANEIHVPVGRTVVVELISHDVIHSFWVPNLAGKKDLVPGHPGSVWFRADRAGVWRGQCAEFCGHQHALMGLLVIAQPPAEFARWYQAQLAPAAEPAPGTAAAKGKEVFLARSCVLCHAIGGTDAAARTGPDLTHLASRRTLAAGTLPNTHAWLGTWVINPQSIKPGAKMPGNTVPAGEMEALIAYLRELR